MRLVTWDVRADDRQVHERLGLLGHFEQPLLELLELVVEVAKARLPGCLRFGTANAISWIFQSTGPR